MKIEHLGELALHENIKEWMVSSQVEVDYFPGARVSFVLENMEGDYAPHEFVAAVGNFLSLTLTDRKEATPYVYRNYTEFLDYVDEDEIEVRIDSPADVWNYVQSS